MLMVLISQAQREPPQLEAEHESAGIGPSQALAMVTATSGPFAVVKEVAVVWVLAAGSSLAASALFSLPFFL